MNDDTFRDWLGDRADTLTKLSGADTLTKLFGDATASEMAYRADEARFILHRYRDIATDDPDDQAAYDAAMEDWRGRICEIIENECMMRRDEAELVLNAVALIAALPKPVKGGVR